MQNVPSEGKLSLPSGQISVVPLLQRTNMAQKQYFMTDAVLKHTEISAHSQRRTGQVSRNEGALREIIFPPRVKPDVTALYCASHH